MQRDQWKILFGNVGMFIKENISLAIICVLLFLFYKEIWGSFAACIIVLMLLLYSVVMLLCSFGMTKIAQHERSGTICFRIVFGYSFLVAMPIYFLWALFSLVPIVQSELWLLTGLPLCLCTGLTLASISEKWVARRTLFWTIQIAIYLTLTVAGQLICRTIFTNL